MDLFLTAGEVNAIKIWAESIIHGGHWGDGDVEIPEEGIILQKIRNIKASKITLNENEVRIILMWSDSTLGIHTMEEASVIKKLQSMLKETT